MRYYKTYYTHRNIEVMVIAKRGETSFSKLYFNNEEYLGLTYSFEKELNGFDGNYEPAIEITEEEYKTIENEFKKANN